MNRFFKSHNKKEKENRKGKKRRKIKKEKEEKKSTKSDYEVMKLPILVSFLIVIGFSDGTWTKIDQAFELSKEARDIDWTLPFVPLENEEKKIQESFSLYYRSQRSNRIYSENPITRHSIRHARKYYRSVNSSMYLQKTWPIKKEAVIEGDLLLGGLMMVHEREDSITCGPVMPQGGIQALEAMLYTLDRLNINEGIIPGVKIGAHILDDCDKDTYGLEMAVDFIKGKYLDQVVIEKTLINDELFFSCFFKK